MSGKNGKVRTCYWCRRWPDCGTPITERQEKVVNGVTVPVCEKFVWNSSAKSWNPKRGK